MTGMADELNTVLAVLARNRAHLVNVGHGRDEDSRQRAEVFLDAWAAAGGEVGAVVSWPSAAASWLRPACRFAAGAPDMWVVADNPVGWTGFGRRLAVNAVWRPARTVAFSGLADPELPFLAGWEATEGMSGSLPDGGVWWFSDRLLHVAGPPVTGAAWR